MKRVLTLILMMTSLFCVNAFAQLDEATMAKRQARKNLVIREWNTDPKTQTKWLDRVTTYDDQGRKIEETEYTKYGQKWRETFEYGDHGRISKNVVYNERNKVTLVRKYEYNADGTKKKQFNYSPNGKLQTVKVFEYSITEGDGN
ncbi:MAG: hypothetical protein II029_00605 [Bacteroidales bacterium]|jgi:hypothetical protein|nr:hypothetical protein [Bacteroidales bacterium]